MQYFCQNQFKTKKLSLSTILIFPSEYFLIHVTAEVSSLMRLTNDAFHVQIQDTSFRQKCLRLRCHDFSALAD